MDRLISIILVLLDTERISAKKLAEMFEVSIRTIYRDIDTIDRSGIPIHSTTGVGGGFEIMPNYKIDHKFFSTTDIFTILRGLSILPTVTGQDELINALVKVKSFIPEEQEKEIDLKVKQLHIDLTNWMGAEDTQPHLELIREALQTQKVLSFNYLDRHGNQTQRNVEPYQLVLKGSRWYFHGYCIERADFRLFRVSRTSNLQIEERSFISRVYQEPHLYFNDRLETLQKNIKIRIHKTIMNSVLDYCSPECFSPEGEDYYRVNFPFIENDYYYNLLLSFGNKCECLEPEQVRTEMKRRINEMAAMYEKK